MDWFKDELDNWIVIQDGIISSKFNEDLKNKLLQLSEANISILESIVQYYGTYSDLELDNLINHQLCTEADYYEKVGLEDVVIPMEYLLENLVYPKTVSHVIAAQLQEQSDLIFAMKLCVV